jgi:hypothetical protein
MPENSHYFDLPAGMPAGLTAGIGMRFAVAVAVRDVSARANHAGRAARYQPSLRRLPSHSSFRIQPRAVAVTRDDGSRILIPTIFTYVTPSPQDPASTNADSGPPKMNNLRMNKIQNLAHRRAAITPCHKSPACSKLRPLRGLKLRVANRAHPLRARDHFLTHPISIQGDRSR